MPTQVLIKPSCCILESQAKILFLELVVTIAGAFYLTDGTSDALKVVQTVAELTGRTLTCNTFCCKEIV